MYVSSLKMTGKDWEGRNGGARGASSRRWQCRGGEARLDRTDALEAAMGGGETRSPFVPHWEFWRYSGGQWRWSCTEQQGRGATGGWPGMPELDGCRAGLASPFLPGCQGNLV